MLGTNSLGFSGLKSLTLTLSWVSGTCTCSGSGSASAACCSASRTSSVSSSGASTPVCASVDRNAFQNICAQPPDQLLYSGPQLHMLLAKQRAHSNTPVRKQRYR